MQGNQDLQFKHGTHRPKILVWAKQHTLHLFLIEPRTVLIFPAHLSSLYFHLQVYCLQQKFLRMLQASEVLPQEEALSRTAEAC